MTRCRWWCAWLLAAIVAGCSTTPSEGEAKTDLDVTFAGASSQFGFRLRRVVEDLLIDFERDPTNEAPLFDAAQDLQDHYVTLGFPDAEVTYRVERDPRLRVVFTIAEGPRVTVERVDLAGNESIDDETLLALWSRTRSGLVGTGDPYFVAEELVAWRVAMRALYGLRGFLEAQVEGPQVEREPTGTTARVRFVIAEGPRYKIADIDVASDLPLDVAALQLDALVGGPYDRDRLETVRQRARLQLEAAGYPSPRVELLTERDAAADTVRAKLAGSPGVRARIVAVGVEGLRRTAYSVVERAIHFAPGEWYDGRKVEQTTSEAYLTGLFRRVEVERRMQNEAGTEVALVVVVEELEAREVDFLLGYGSYESLRGGVTYTDRNMFGFGHRVSVSARASFKSEGLSASYTMPNLLGTKTSLITGGYVRQREEPTFTDFSRGVDVALARDLFSAVRGRIGYALQSRDASTDLSVSGTAPDSFEIGSVFGEVILDRRDSPLYPMSGHREDLKFERARRFLGGDVELDRLTWSAELFLPLAEDVVFGVSARGGIAWSHDDGGLPVQERFFNGGESSVRSFEEADLGPRAPTGVPQGGAYFNVLSSELRFPLLGALHGATFVDAGNVGVDPGEYGLSELRYGIGVGLRLVLPIGPIRLDAAVNPDRRPGEDTWVLHLAVGLPF